MMTNVEPIVCPSRIFKKMQLPLSCLWLLLEFWNVFIFSCSSPIGKREGKEIVFVGQGCENKGAILHELVYLLGFYDEHNRADRDDYIQIFEENNAQGTSCVFNSICL